MPPLNLSVSLDTLEPGEEQRVSGIHTAVWPTLGNLFWQGVELAAGEGHLLTEAGSLSAGLEGASLVRFTVGRHNAEILQASTALGAHSVVAPSSQILLRLDKVSFPAGATAWRHVHPGPGFRYLIKGRLRLEADDHTRNVEAGDCWFEAANSPVKATASEEESETAFIRLMVLPREYAGQRTINILSEQDRARERLQTTTTYFDVEVDL